MTTTTTPTVTSTLTHSDRCDRCGAQAFVKVDIKGNDLLFCAHHFAGSELMLVSQGATVVTDARESINTKPSVAAF